MGPHTIRVNRNRSIFILQFIAVSSLQTLAHNRILKIARTIADLKGAANIQSTHVAEAMQYRTLDQGKRFV